MSLVPSGLWSRLITRLLIMIDVQILQKGGHNDPDKAISEQHQMLRQSMPSFGRYVKNWCNVYDINFETGCHRT